MHPGSVSSSPDLKHKIWSQCTSWRLEYVYLVPSALPAHTQVYHTMIITHTHALHTHTPTSDLFCARAILVLIWCASMPEMVMMVHERIDSAHARDRAHFVRAQHAAISCTLLIIIIKYRSESINYARNKCSVSWRHTCCWAGPDTAHMYLCMKA